MNNTQERLHKVLHALVDCDNYVGLIELGTMLNTGEWEEMQPEAQKLLLADYEDSLDITN